ncbi:MAG: S41 family peptidase [Bacilli bacterium]|nr:S41 family peptidase [Bacilli bacterium]
MKFIKTKKTTKEQNEIKKSKQIIKKEKEKIRQERQKIKKLKHQRIANSKLFKKIFKFNDNRTYNSIKSQIFNLLYYEFLGVILCLLVLFILSGGKNYLKLYYELNKFIDIYDTLTSNYYGKIDKQELIDTAISSMVANINDGFTSYSDEEGTEEFEETVNGIYEGIGSTVSTDKEGKITIIEVFDDSPAQRAGLKEGDIIKKIDDKDFSKKTSEDMANYIKSSKNSKIKLTILREEQEQEITLKREKIRIPTVSSKIIENDNKKIGYINISIFSTITTNQFVKQLKKLEKEKIKALIIDVRDNNGGYLKTATEISNMFLKKGQIVYQLSDKSGTIKEKDRTKEHREYPVAILTNKNSASASEILAAAIKESYNGHVVGTRTFGKGTVQKTKKLNDGTMVKFTVQKWLTPKGTWINNKGLEPTDKVETTDNNDTDKDNQLDSAVDILIRDLK